MSNTKKRLSPINKPLAMPAETASPRRRPVFRVQVEPKEGVTFYGMFDRMPTLEEVYQSFSIAESQGRISLGSANRFSSLGLNHLPEPPIIGEFSTAYYVQLPIGRLTVVREWLNLSIAESTPATAARTKTRKARK
jgi:hypothetical protein